MDGYRAPHWKQIRPFVIGLCNPIRTLLHRQVFSMELDSDFIKERQRVYDISQLRITLERDTSEEIAMQKILGMQSYVSVTRGHFNVCYKKNYTGRHHWMDTKIALWKKRIPILIKTVILPIPRLQWPIADALLRCWDEKIPV